VIFEGVVEERKESRIKLERGKTPTTMRRSRKQNTKATMLQCDKKKHTNSHNLQPI